MQWHQLDHIQTISTSLQTDNHANTSSLIYYRSDALPEARPTVSKNLRQIKDKILTLTSAVIPAHQMGQNSRTGQAHTG